VIITEVFWSIFIIKIQDIYFASIEDFRALEQYDEHMNHVFDLLPTHAFLKQFLIKILHINPLLYILVNRIFLVLFANNFLIYSCNVLCKRRDFFVALRPNAVHGLILEVSRSHTTTQHSR